MRRNVALAAALLLALAANCAAHAAPAPRGDDGSKLVGDWEGESKCGAGFPSCRDEHVVYHVAKPPDAAGNVSIAADKIVDGKPVPMGVIELKYDGEKHTLRGELKNTRYSGVWEFKVEGDTMEGTLTMLPEGKVARRMKVRKVS
jgi:hypothetical protein